MHAVWAFGDNVSDQNLMMLINFGIILSVIGITIDFIENKHFYLTSELHPSNYNVFVPSQTRRNCLNPLQSRLFSIIPVTRGAGRAL